MHSIKGIFPIHPQTRPAAGFTLLELIIALTVLGLISAIVFSSLGVALNSYSASQERIQEKSRQRVLFDQIKRQIGSLFPLHPTGGFLDEESLGTFMQPLPESPLQQAGAPLFYGISYEMIFITVAPLLLHENPGLAVVRYGLAQDGDGNYYLGIMETRFLGLKSFVSMVETPVGEPLPLIENISSLDFQYLGYDATLDIYDWYDHWDARETLTVPLAVRINFNREPVASSPQYLVAAVNARSAPGRAQSGLVSRGGQ